MTGTKSEAYVPGCVSHIVSVCCCGGGSGGCSRMLESGQQLHSGQLFWPEALHSLQPSLDDGLNCCWMYEKSSPNTDKHTDHLNISRVFLFAVLGDWLVFHFFLFVQRHTMAELKCQMVIRNVQLGEGARVCWCCSLFFTVKNTSCLYPQVLFHKLLTSSNRVLKKN